MKKMLVFLFLFTFAFHGFSQDYRTHKVKDGDTVYKLANQYNTTPEAIYTLNPGSKASIRLGQVLVLPPEKIGEIKAKEPRRFETYRVKSKETVFGISQQYGIDMADLKKYNPYLYKSELGKDDTLQIPVYTQGKPQPLNYNQSLQNSSFGNLKHIVLPRETKYGIAEQYGMEVSGLKKLNPDMGVIQPGQILTVRRNNSASFPVIKDESKFEIYVVQPYKEGSPETIYSLTRKLGVSRDSLYVLNPNLKRDGLEAGMKLKVPLQKNATTVGITSEITDLEKNMVNYSPKNIVVLLPFHLNKFEDDSISQQKSQLKSNRVSRISLDFYSGILMALETAKKRGISVNLRTFDTEQSQDKIRGILTQHSFEETDAVIGPLLDDMVRAAAQEFESRNIPVFSPLTDREMTGHKNLFQTRPGEKAIRLAMMGYMDSLHANQNIVILADNQHTDIKNKLQNRFPTAQYISLEGDYIERSKIASALQKEAQNWVIVETGDIALIGSILSHLNLIRSAYPVRLFTTLRGNAYESDEVSNVYLSNLRFTFPSIGKEFNDEKAADFISEYQNQHGIRPSKYAVRGYDLTYDILLRLAAAEDLYRSVEANWTTEYTENKFHYREKKTGGYLNNAVYILKYGDGLSVNPVKL